MNQNFAHEITESGYIPDSLIRRGIRALLRQRLQEINVDDIEETADAMTEFLTEMKSSPIAVMTEKANEQHYEVPQEFYEHVLGEYAKYSCCYWDDSTQTLSGAEYNALRITCERAQIEDGMNILELGCGWGSLSTWIAREYPNAHVTAVSNSRSQGAHIKRLAMKNGLRNIDVVTADMVDFEAAGLYDRIISLEMFEHLRNYQKMFERVCQWLEPDGKFFMHIFTHRNTPYLFEDKDDSDWMTRFFFSGGMMPSEDLPLHFQDHLRLERRWRWNGKHYQKTAEAWLENLDNNKRRLWSVLENTYGQDNAKTWFMRWRMFFLAVSELFGYNDGNEWYVTHYLFSERTL